jgi:hypothetical protein
MNDCEWVEMMSSLQSDAVGESDGESVMDLTRSEKEGKIGLVGKLKRPHMASCRLK